MESARDRKVREGGRAMTGRNLELMHRNTVCGLSIGSHVG